MKAWIKATVAITLSLMFGFTCIGYAALTNVLYLDGSVEVPAYVGIYISKVDAPVSTNQDFTCNSYSATVLNSRVSLGSESDSVVVPITVKNSTSDIYGYSISYAMTGENTYDNSSVTYSLWLDEACTVAMEKGELLYQNNAADHPQDGNTYPTELTFYIKFTVAEGATGAQTLNSILNFEFITPPPEKEEDSGSESIVENVEEQMEDILNDPTKLQKLLTQIKTPPEDSNRDADLGYVGNVAGSHTEDTQVVEELFGGRLNLVINGVAQDVTVMIKYEDIDSDGIRDIVLYSTPYDPADYEPASNMFASGGEAMPVWAQIYRGTAEDDAGDTSAFERLGESYEGTARVNQYNPDSTWWGGLDYTGNDSFNTNSWVSSKDYTVNGAAIASGSDIGDFSNALTS